jgi:hypothetical protein
MQLLCLDYSATPIYCKQEASHAVQLILASTPIEFAEAHMPVLSPVLIKVLQHEEHEEYSKWGGPLLDAVLMKAVDSIPVERHVQYPGFFHTCDESLDIIIKVSKEIAVAITSSSSLLLLLLLCAHFSCFYSLWSFVGHEKSTPPEVAVQRCMKMFNVYSLVDCTGL